MGKNQFIRPRNIESGEEVYKKRLDLSLWFARKDSDR
jgi:hypothetical protein